MLILEIRVLNTFSSLDSKGHAVRRRRVSNVYSKSWLQASAHMDSITTTLLYKRLLPFLTDCAQNDTAVDVLEMSFASGLDFVSAFFFGTSCSTNFIQNEEKRKRWLDAYLKAHDYVFWVQELPVLLAWLAKIGINIIPERTVEANEELDVWCLNMCTAAEKVLLAQQNGEEIISGSLPVVYQQLKVATTKEMKQSDPTPLALETQRLEIASELLDHLCTVPTSLACAFAADSSL